MHPCTPQDPKAFQDALRDDAVRLAKVQAIPAVAAIMLGDDLEQMQGLLRDAHKVSIVISSRHASYTLVCLCLDI
jgi:hypothetical protein